MSQKKRRKPKEINELKESRHQRAQKLTDDERVETAHHKQTETRKSEAATLREEVKRLRQQEMSQNIARQKRILRHKRAQQHQKLESESQRLHAMTEFKETVIQQRRLQSEMSAQQKETMVKQISRLLKSDAAGVESMMNLANQHLGDTKGLQNRLKKDFGIDLHESDSDTWK